MARDLHNNVKVLRVVSPVAIGTTGTGQVGKIIDRAGYEGVEFIVSYGTVTATDAPGGGAVFTLRLPVSLAMRKKIKALAGPRERWGVRASDRNLLWKEKDLRDFVWCQPDRKSVV